jgi:hypothetical protein
MRGHLLHFVKHFKVFLFLKKNPTCFQIIESIILPKVEFLFPLHQICSGFYALFLTNSPSSKVILYPSLIEYSSAFNVFGDSPFSCCGF